jgi:hypothetical protein
VVFPSVDVETRGRSMLLPKQPFNNNVFIVRTGLGEQNLYRKDNTDLFPAEATLFTHDHYLSQCESLTLKGQSGG